MKKTHSPIGASFNDWLAEEGLLTRATNTALKRGLAWLLLQEMKRLKISKTAMAQRIGTSRAALDRLLDEDNLGLTLHTLGKVADAVGQDIIVTFRPRHVPQQRPRRTTKKPKRLAVSG